jgi:hypothetical protein
MDKLNQWLTLVANVGVLIGIGFLAFEIRQNTDSIHSQTRATLFAGAQEELWKNMEYPDVTINILSTDHELSAAEKVRLDAWLTAAMRAKEYAWMEFQSQNVDEHHWRSERKVIGIILGTKRTRNWWSNMAKETFRSDFAFEVDEIISESSENDYVEKILAIE